jgi:hypothetical protein
MTKYVLISKCHLQARAKQLETHVFMTQKKLGGGGGGEEAGGGAGQIGIPHQIGPPRQIGGRARLGISRLPARLEVEPDWTKTARLLSARLPPDWELGQIAKDCQIAPTRLPPDCLRLPSHT